MNAQGRGRWHENVFTGQLSKDIQKKMKKKKQVGKLLHDNKDVKVFLSNPLLGKDWALAVCYPYIRCQVFDKTPLHNNKAQRVFVATNECQVGWGIFLSLLIR